MNGVDSNDETSNISSEENLTQLITTKDPAINIFPEQNDIYSNGKGNEDEITNKCTMCENTNIKILNLLDNSEMHQTLLTFWKMPPENIRRTLESICVQCIYKINAHKEMTQCLQLRLHRLTQKEIHAYNINPNPEWNYNIESLCNGGEGRADSSSDAKSCIAMGSKCNSPPTPGGPCSTSTISSGIIIENNTHENILTKEALPKLITPPRADSTVAESPSNQNETYEFAQSSDQRRNRNFSCHSTISPIFGILNNVDDYKNRTHSPAMSKESRKSIHSGTSNSTSLNNRLPMLEIYREESESALVTESGGKITNYRNDRNTKTLPCKYCSKVYKRKDHYRKHIRLCAARERSRARSIGASELNRSRTACSIAESTITNDTSYNREYHCPSCPVTVKSLKRLREHRLIHLQRFFCPTCCNEFTARYDYEFHSVICAAKKQGQRLAKGSDDDVSISETQFTGRMTRARSYAKTRASSLSAWSRANTSYSHYFENDDYDSDVDEKEEDCGEDEQEKDEESEDGVSVADTMYSRRMSFTDNWIQHHQKSYLDFTEVDSFFNDDIPMRTQKEYDLYILNRLKAEILLNRICCTEPNCNVYARDLLTLMIHDYQKHFNGVWFYCPKCGNVFRKKVFLDYHLDRQSPGNYICYKCGEIFVYQHQLDFHLIRHTHCVNYICNYCKFEFLSEFDLVQHCINEEHDPNGERTMITIDHSLTITNALPAKYNTINNELRKRRPNDYRIHDKILNLPKTPSMRCMSLPGHAPYRLQVGDIEFFDMPVPNCSSWK